MTTVSLELPPGVALLTMNRRGRLNSMNMDLVESLRTSLQQISADNACRVVVLTGAGRGFCSGADLRLLPREAAGHALLHRMGVAGNPTPMRAVGTAHLGPLRTPADRL
jgi:enoyl-CoA hydratase